MEPGYNAASLGIGFACDATTQEFSAANGLSRLMNEESGDGELINHRRVNPARKQQNKDR